MAGTIAIVTGAASRELRSQWLAQKLPLFSQCKTDTLLSNTLVASLLPDVSGEYKRVRTTAGKCQQTYIMGADVVSIFFPASSAADIAEAQGWVLPKGKDGSLYCALIGQNDPSSMKFVNMRYPILMVSRIKLDRLGEHAESIKRSMYNYPQVISTWIEYLIKKCIAPADFPVFRPGNPPTKRSLQATL